VAPPAVLVPLVRASISALRLQPSMCVGSTRMCEAHKSCAA
jgi:hypothetical protein